MAFLTTLALSLIVVVTADKSTTISLDQVWAWDMPGTTSIKQAEKIDSNLSKTEQRKLSPAVDIFWILSNTDKSYTEKPIRGFVVDGTGKTALRNAQKVLSGKVKHLELVSPDQELSLVFFSKHFGRKVVLDEVIQAKSTFTIKYHFHGHHSLGGTPNFALIPVGKLKKGGYVVNILQNTPTAEKEANKSLLDRSFVDQIISKSFTFNVMDILPGG